MGDTIKCKSCETQNSPDVKVCRRCGSELDQPLRPSNGLKTDGDEQMQIGPEPRGDPSIEGSEDAEIVDLDDSSSGAIPDEAEDAETESDLYEIEQGSLDRLTTDDSEDARTQGEEGLTLLDDSSSDTVSDDAAPDISATHTEGSWLGVVGFIARAACDTMVVLGVHIARQARICAARLAAWRIGRQRSHLLEGLGHDGLSTEQPVAELAELRDEFIELDRNIGEKDQAIADAREEEPDDSLTSQMWHFFAKTNKTVGLRLKRRRLRNACAKICHDAGERLIESGERKDAFGEPWDRVAELDGEIAAASERIGQLKAQQPTPLHDIWQFQGADEAQPPTSEQ